MWSAPYLYRKLFARPAAGRFVPRLLVLEDRSQPAVLIPASAAVTPPPDAPPGLNGDWYDRNDPAGFLTTFDRADAVVRNDPVAATFRATTAAYFGPGTLGTLLGADAPSIAPAAAAGVASSPFVMRLRGFLTIDPSHDTVPGNGTIDVRFAVSSDDDTRLRIGGQTVLTAPTISLTSETASFEAAGSYPVELTWFDHFGGVFFRWWSSIPGGPAAGAPPGTVGLVPVSVLSAAPAPTGVFTVTNTSDSGPGSLRQALLDANAAPTAAEVRFQIPTTDPNFADADSGLAGGDPEADVAVIRPLSALPAVTNPRGVRIDARTQTTLVGNTNPFGPEVVLDGGLAGTTADGLSLLSDGNAVFGLNVRSFNGFLRTGVRIAGGDGNWLAGNFIGTNATGTAAAANFYGVWLQGGASRNVVGTDGDGISDAAEGNLISGNLDGVRVQDGGTNDNVVAGNRVGTDRTGTAAVPNTNHGVNVLFGPQANRLGTNGDGVSDADERNLLSGNALAGVTFQFAGTDRNVVAGNFIGVSAGGAKMGNGTHGVDIQTGARFTRVGTNGDGIGDTAERNVISGNAQSGVMLLSAGTSGNVVAGNFIGTNPAGTAAVANGKHGVFVLGGASNNRVGTNADGANDTAERNVISGNVANGVTLNDLGTDNNVVAGNYIGLNAAGTVAVPNSQGVRIASGARTNLIGGSMAAARNVVSGNSGPAGIVVFGVGTDDNVIAGNWVGLNAAGAAALPNNRGGIEVLTGGRRNRIGTDGDGVNDAAERNVVSGNAGFGVLVQQPGTRDTVIAGNYIGTNPAGTAAIGNATFGVWVINSAANTRIGTDGNGIGDDAERNLISGNGQDGVQLLSAGTADTVIAGNYIGTDAAGTAGLPNGFNGVLVDLAIRTRIGTDGSPDAFNLGERNIIAANGRNGVVSYLGATGTVVAGNFIGIGADAITPLGNGQRGVYVALGATDNRVGTDGNGVGDAAEWNRIAFNARQGVQIDGTPTVRNRVRGNAIYANALGGIDLINGGNLDQPAPVLVRATAAGVAGTATGPANSSLTIDLYANPATDSPPQARRYLGSVTTTTDAAGTAAFAAPLAGLSVGETVTATVTDAAGNTSELSAPAAVAPAVPVAVAGVAVNDGAAQRSMVSRITVTFTGRVAIDPGAFALTRRDGVVVTLGTAVSVVGGRTVVELTFAGTGQPFGSLADGRYTLTIDPAGVRDADFGTDLDGDGDGVAGGAYSNASHIQRLFGDLNGDATVDSAELLAFRRAFGSVVGGTLYNPLFDFNGDGRIDATDRTEIARRFGTTL